MEETAAVEAVAQLGVGDGVEDDRVDADVEEPARREPEALAPVSHGNQQVGMAADLLTVQDGIEGGGPDAGVARPGACGRACSPSPVAYVTLSGVKLCPPIGTQLGRARTRGHEAPRGGPRVSGPGDGGGGAVGDGDFGQGTCPRGALRCEDFEAPVAV